MAATAAKVSTACESYVKAMIDTHAALLKDLLALNDDGYDIVEKVTTKDDDWCLLEGIVVRDCSDIVGSLQLKISQMASIELDLKAHRITATEAADRVAQLFY
jgi:hypothetical protein